MEIKLVVANGKNVGQKIPIVGTNFRIGRADDCQLRPRSDVISRYHCTIRVEGNFIIVRDGGSKNGTFVNDEQVMGEQELRNGDRLRVGQLEFDLELSADMGAAPGPQDQEVSDGGTATVEEGVANQLDLSDWLGQDDSSGTVLGMLPLRRATSLDREDLPGKSDKPKGGDTNTDPPK